MSQRCFSASRAMGPVTVVLVQLLGLAVIGQYGRGQGRPSAGPPLACNISKEDTKMTKLIQQLSFFCQVLYFKHFFLLPCGFLASVRKWRAKTTDCVRPGARRTRQASAALFAYNVVPLKQKFHYNYPLSGQSDIWNNFRRTLSGE